MTTIETATTWSVHVTYGDEERPLLATRAGRDPLPVLWVDLEWAVYRGTPYGPTVSAACRRSSGDTVRRSRGVRGDLPDWLAALAAEQVPGEWPGGGHDG